MEQSGSNQAARELWEQIFARLASAEYAAIVDPDHDETADEERMRTGMAEAGWSDVEIAVRLQAARTDRSGSARNSPGVAPNIERQLDRLCQDVERAMSRMGHGSHVRLARGVEPVVGPAASMTNVIMTDEGILTVTSFFFRFCGLIARAFTRTLRLDPYLWEAPDYSEESAIALLRTAPALVRYWLSIFLSYGVTGTHAIVPYRPATPQELIHFEQVARAMELFAVAHEYGHHHRAHGRNLADKARRHEFEADQFALEICYEIERQPYLVQIRTCRRGPVA